jgi:hypothetical protein
MGVPARPRAPAGHRPAPGAPTVTRHRPAVVVPTTPARGPCRRRRRGHRRAGTPDNRRAPARPSRTGPVRRPAEDRRPDRTAWRPRRHPVAPARPPGPTAPPRRWDAPSRPPGRPAAARRRVRCASCPRPDGAFPRPRAQVHHPRVGRRNRRRTHRPRRCPARPPARVTPPSATPGGTRRRAPACLPSRSSPDRPARRRRPHRDRNPDPGPRVSAPPHRPGGRPPRRARPRRPGFRPHPRRPRSASAAGATRVGSSWFP